ncbi:MAG TPA: FtsX-like permease family protein [Pyrinomonadaceae bacterium]|jgi:ABC-type lipoprotein release transport system permease subunit
MNTALLLKRNLAYYWRTNLAVICGVAVAVAVLAGALLVGDSVRASLRDLFLQRLGSTEQVITAASFFREQLADEIQLDERFAASGYALACPLIVLDGTITHEASKRWATNVQVYGVDERFWRFHGRETAAALAPQNRDVLVGASLADELNTKPGDALLLRIEKPSAIPVESLHGRKEELGRTVRLTAREKLDSSALGDFSLRPQQTAVRVVFVPLRLLQKELEQSGKVNTVLLSAASGEKGQQASADGGASIQNILKDKATLADLGIKLRSLEQQQSLSLESETALLNEQLTETASATAKRLGMNTAPVLSYLANTIRSGEREIPYSIVTAIDEERLRQLRRGDASQSVAASSASSLPQIVLNDWAARELNVQTGARVTLEYYVWQDEGRLLTKTAEFQLAGVVPIEGLAADRDLVPEYPGITGTESLSDWDPPFPVNLARIKDRDEQYWDEYRTTPKAFIPLEAGQKIWPSRFGKLTSLRILPGQDAGLQSALESYGQTLRAALDPLQVGFVLYGARAEGLAASRGATNFGEYFLYFSFFLVLSAFLLAALFFKLGVEQRLREIGILQAIGFPAARLRRLFLIEGVVLATIGSVLGLAGAFLYGKLMMLGLTTWWVGAVGTTLLKLHVSPLSLLLGGVGGVLAALVCVVWTLRRLAPASPRSLLTGTALTDAVRRNAETRRGGNAAKRFSYTFIAAIVFGLAALIVLLAAALGRIGEVAGFFGGGTLLLVSLLCLQAVWLGGRKGRLLSGTNWWSVARLGFRNAAHRSVRSVLCIALIASASFIIVAVDAFKRDNKNLALDRKSGSGGYRLLAESALPLVHDPNTAEGREALNLATAQQDEDVLSGVAFARFRVRPGDDASCLNLYQPRNPRILAPTDDFLRGNRFRFQASLAQTAEEKENPWLLLNAERGDGSIPVMADANSMTYVLHLKLGDEFVLNREGASPLHLRIVGALSDSIFQSELLMSEKNFLRLFPEQEGYRFFLLDTPSPENFVAATKILEEQLSDFGFDVTTTGERLASFHRVENTFISTFQMLGGLGLALGTLGLAAVLLRNVLERRRELALLRAVGYNATHFALMVVAENALLLFCGLLTGTACALLAIAPVFSSRGGQLPFASLGLLLLAVVISGLLASLVATAAALRSPLLPALRAE